MAQQCGHLDTITHETPRVHVCEDCVKIGARWLHLRLCTECGHVGCCDSSPNKHATKHFHDSNHPVIKSAERGEDWFFCYVDDLMFE